jgi:hypothetical protein
VDDVEKKGVEEIKSHGVQVVTQVDRAAFQAAWPRPTSSTPASSARRRWTRSATPSKARQA